MMARPDLVSAWLQYQTDGTEQNFWAIQEMLDLVQEDSDGAWETTVELVHKASTAWQLNSIGCGPLEDLLDKDWAKYIDRLEALADGDERFVGAAASVWTTDEQLRSRLDGLLRAHGQSRL